MRHLFALAIAVSCTVALAGAASADSAYHTQRFLLSGDDGAGGGGMVVNAHANGPTIYSHEVYVLNSAVPGTYQVTLNVFDTSLNCTGELRVFDTATLTTDAEGNGAADATFTLEQVDSTGLRPGTVSAYWELSGLEASYSTACTVITLD